MNNICKEIRRHLLTLQDEGYREFHSKLIPTVDKDKIIGIRTPILRKYAKEISKREDIEDFLDALPHKYYEENNLHAFILSDMKDFDYVLNRYEELLPYIDNWATCDIGAPKVFKKNKYKLLPYMNKWIESDKTYIIRYGINMYMSLFLDEDFKVEYAERVAAVKSEDYYVNMVIAWYFATALAKKYEDIIPFIEDRVLDEWTHKKTIQKARESYRITDEQKEYLKRLK